MGILFFVDKRLKSLQVTRSSGWEGIPPSTVCVLSGTWFWHRLQRAGQKKVQSLAPLSGQRVTGSLAWSWLLGPGGQVEPWTCLCPSRGWKTQMGRASLCVSSDPFPEYLCHCPDQDLPGAVSKPRHTHGTAPPQSREPRGKTAWIPQAVPSAALFPRVSPILGPRTPE